MEETKEVALLPEKIDAVTVFTGEQLDEFLARIKAAVSTMEPDTSTAKGRKEIASMAYKVAQSKTRLDNLGKDLVADWKKQSKLVDDSRKKARDYLDALKDEVRQPLTDWELAEEARVLAEKEAAEYAAAWDEAHALHDLYLREQAIAAKEAEQARKEEEARAKAEADEVARKAKEEAEAAEKARIAREEQWRKEAEEKAQREAAEAVAKAERERIAAEERAKFAAEQAERDRAAAEVKALADQEAAVKAAQDAERARVAAAEREKAEAEAKAKAAEERRAADKRHQAKINNEALADLVAGGYTEDQGKAIITLLATGKIRHITINY